MGANEVYYQTIKKSCRIKPIIAAQVEVSSHDVVHVLNQVKEVD